MYLNRVKDTWNEPG